MLCGRGINFRDRHLMKDIKNVMPHHRAESKLERWKTLTVINELGDMKHCNKAMYFEGRHKQDLYMWLSCMPDGPSAKFYMENIATMSELKLTGNCLKGARPLLSFDQQFSKIPHLMLLREILTQVFGVPNHHPKSQPFVDRVYTFTFLDNRIWFRNYQSKKIVVLFILLLLIRFTYSVLVLAEDGALAEIGPRFVMNPVKIFAESFGGEAIWENPDYVAPAKHRRLLRTAAKDKYLNRTEVKARYEATQPTEAFKLDKFGHEVFADGEEEMAQKLVEQELDIESEGDVSEIEDEDKQQKREAKEIERVKALIEKLKPGGEGKELVRKKKKSSKGKIMKATSKKGKMIKNIVKTKKLQK